MSSLETEENNGFDMTSAIDQFYAEDYPEDKDNNDIYY